MQETFGAHRRSAEDKRYRRGTHRTRLPGETLRLIEPHLEDFGITRVADVTALDAIGIPVTQVIRPNARTISVSAGKGVDLLAAKASGLGEAIETACAEGAPLGAVLEPAALLGREAAIVDVVRFPTETGASLPDDQPIPWVEGVELLSDAPTWVPMELVGLDFVRGYQSDTWGHFRQSSSGLAAGNTWEEATLHGLCELVERDDAARLRQLPARADWDLLVDLTSVDPVSDNLVSRFREAGIAVAAWEMTGPSGLPSFTVMIADPHADPELHPIPVCGGHGCHTDPSVALCRALVEAAQSRLTGIVGSREDVDPTRRRLSHGLDLLESHRRVIEAAATRGPRGFSAAPNLSGDSVAVDRQRAIASVHSMGIDQVVVVDLSPPDLPISVTRVVAPGLQRDPPDWRAQRDWRRIRIEP
jgi:ribosomal protein S12 methylthiotransferase accessory factor